MPKNKMFTGLGSLLVAALLLSLMVGANAANAEESAAATPNNGSIEDIVTTCNTCHGADAIAAVPTNPRLDGQHRDYLLISMQRYLNGERDNIVMTSLLAGYSDRELKALAKYYSQQKGLWDTAFPRFK